MNIKLPLETMSEGVSKGGSLALAQNSKMLIKLSATKSELKIESGDDKRRVVHIIPTSKSVVVMDEGTWCFEGAELYKTIKRLGSKRQVGGKSAREKMNVKTTPVPWLTLKYSPPQKDEETVHYDFGQSIGALNWVVNDGQGAMNGSIPAYSDSSFKALREKQDGQCLLELNPSALGEIIKQVADIKTEGVATTALSSCNGLLYIFKQDKRCAVVREITPSEIEIPATKDFCIKLTDLETLASILETVNKSSEIKSIRLCHSPSGRVLNWEVGQTELFSLVESSDEDSNGININFDIINMDSPRVSFAVQADILTSRLKTLITPVGANEVHASFASTSCLIDNGDDRDDVEVNGGENKTIFKLEYIPKKTKGKYQPNNYPAEATMPCHDIEGDNALKFSFDPNLIWEFVRGLKSVKPPQNDRISIAISYIPKSKLKSIKGVRMVNFAKNPRAIMRIQAINNPRLAFFTTVALEPPVA
ncbi:MAG: hypothetical protein WCL49_03540 [bacterium]